MCSWCIQAPRSFSERFGAGARPVHPILGHAAIAELRPVSEDKAEVGFEPAKGSFWRKAVARSALENVRWIGLINAAYGSVKG